MNQIKIRYNIFIALFAFSVMYAYANGDPVVKYSSINRVANPEPLSISEIRILHEQVNISHVDGYNCFDITYKFKNESDKDFPEIHYGFPIDYLVADEQEVYQLADDYYTESMYEVGWCDNLIKDVRFKFNGKDLSFQSARESVREAGFVVETYDDGEYVDSIPTDAVNRRWYYTQFSMKPHSEATFNVRYKVYANSNTGLYTADNDFSLFSRANEKPDEYILNHPMPYRYFASQFTILYDFTPARHFGNGRSYVLDVAIDLSNLTNPWIKPDDDLLIYTPRLERSYYIAAQDIKPINLTVYHSDNRSKNEVERIIRPFIISDSGYNVKTDGDFMEIDFAEPTFVSDIACEIDTMQVTSIQTVVTLADGREERYIHKSQNYSGDQIRSPVLLTITDLNHDGMRWDKQGLICTNHTGDFDNDLFKVKNIRLIFNRVPSTSSRQPFGNLRILDARFTKP